MTKLTDQQRLELIASAIDALARLYQDLACAPAFTLVHDSEVKKSKINRRCLPKSRCATV